ncbi:MAG: DNA recombination protein RmuC [Patescibacteria group bacterium]|nr:DNA recombination protein RmuC [Patescibacteria group bacterium]
MQNVILYSIIVVLLGGFGILLYFLLSIKKQSEKPADDASLKVMMEWMKEIKQGTEKTREGMQQSINETNKAINERLDNAARVIGALQGKLGEMTQIGPDIRRLSEVLASPKARGNFGEEMLESLLAETLPKSVYGIQYKFKNGETVDAYVSIDGKILPIDSKFSMENFRLYKEAKDDDTAETLKKAFFKDVKKRIDEIHKKYILPQENTFDFALMYVPSEGVYSEIVESLDLMGYCRKQNVIPVSPNTLFAYMRIMIISLRGQQINEAAQEIMKMISGIKQESDKFGRNLEILGKHIVNAGNAYTTVGTDFAKLKTSITNAATLQLKEAAEPEKAALETQKLLE